MSAKNCCTANSRATPSTLGLKWTLKDMTCVKSLRLCLHGGYAQISPDKSPTPVPLSSHRGLYGYSPSQRFALDSYPFALDSNRNLPRISGGEGARPLLRGLNGSDDALELTATGTKTGPSSSRPRSAVLPATPCRGSATLQEVWRRSRRRECVQQRARGGYGTS